MIVVGVTGGVGTGKSTVARILGRRLKAHVLDADQIAHALMEPNSPVWRGIKARFGKEVITPSGEIDRCQLGGITFRDRRKLKALTRIIHPAVRRRIQAELSWIRRQDPGAVAVLDIPLLIEAGSRGRSGNPYPVDFLVVVSAPLAVVAWRLKSRPGWGLPEIKRRQAFQMPLRRKEQLADFVVKNDGSLAATRRQVAAISKRIITKERS
ncbi:MAG: dephospho-CoA kinase [Candidatus Omnitrophica bacterium]|nr:dephospho-CoA kinase [Candidatus Omnitrophota bacterium]